MESGGVFLEQASCHLCMKVESWVISLEQTINTREQGKQDVVQILSNNKPNLCVKSIKTVLQIVLANNRTQLKLWQSHNQLSQQPARLDV